MKEISVVIPTHNQRERLRLVLCGLAQQSLAAERFEVVVVDDGSTDGTEVMLAQAGLDNLRVVRQVPCQGRNRARNRGAAVARGELIVFLDGDALPAPELLEVYLEEYRRWGNRAVLCGFQRCLPDLEFFQDPQRGSLMEIPIPSVVKDYLAVHREEMVVSEAMIKEEFSTIRSRARDGGYPFAESRERQEQVLELLGEHPQAQVRWLGFIPHNGALPRLLFEEAGGFDENMPFSEGWELAYRLQRYCGAGIYPVRAESHHLYHYHPFAEEALKETEKRYRAIEQMAEKHRDPRLRLLYFWYAHFWPDPFIPEEAVIHDLVDFDRLYRELPDSTWRDWELLLQNHPTIRGILGEIQPETAGSGDTRVA